MCVCILNSPFCSIELLNAHCLDIVDLKHLEISPQTLITFELFPKLFLFCWVFAFQISLRISCPVFTNKKSSGIFIEIALHL